MQCSHLKRICICEDEALPVIIKINPCPGKSCPYARESVPSFISEESSISVLNFPVFTSEETIPEVSTESEKVDSSTSTSEGKSSTGTEVYDSFDRVECPAFEKEGKCVNDVECTTTSSLHMALPSKIVAHKANQIICTHTKLTLEEQEKNLEENIMRIQSGFIQHKSLESTNIEILENQTSRISVIQSALDNQ